MCWRKVIVTGSLATGSVQVDLLSSTRSGSASENAPLVRRPGSLTVSVASPAVLITFALVPATYSRSTPGANAPKLADAPSVRLSVGATLPPTEPVAGTISVTVTAKLPVLVLPAASVAVQVTVLVPTGKRAPDGGSQVTGTPPSTASVAVGAKLTAVPSGPDDVAVTSRRLSAGAARSQPWAAAKARTLASGAPAPRVESR